LQNWVADIMYDVVAHSWYEVFDNISWDGTSYH
jgi:hypothetical protein